MSNVGVNKSDEGKRKKILKKAALLATVASITSAVAVSNQKPKESEALIGAIIGIISTVVGIGGSIASSVANVEAEKKANEEARREAQRQAEEEKRRQEEERMQYQLENSSDHNVRLEQNDSAPSKEINISIADNSGLSDAGSFNSIRNNGGLQKPPNPPKGIHVGGFGQEDEEEVTVQNVVTENTNESNYVENETPNTQNDVKEHVEENKQDVVEEIVNNHKEEVAENNNHDKAQLNNNVTTNNNKDSQKTESSKPNNTNKPVINKVNTNGNKDKGDINVVVTTPSKVNKPTLNKNNGNKIPSNMIKFEIDEGEDDGVVFEEIIINTGKKSNEKLKVEVSEDMLMDLNDASNHDLVKQGLLDAEDLVLLDFGIRSGSITSEIIEIMHNNGDITDSYYEAAQILLSEAK